MTEFDDPLPFVSQDNLDIEVRIGPRETFERGQVSGTDRNVIRPTEDAREYNIIEAEIELTSKTKTNVMSAIVTGDGHNTFPQAEAETLLDESFEPDLITIDIDNQLTREQDRGSSDSIAVERNEVTRIFTGTVSNASRLGDYRFELLAFWPGHNALSTSVTSVNASVGNEPIKKQFLVSSIIDRFGDRIASDPFEIRNELTDDGTIMYTAEDGGDDLTREELLEELEESQAEKIIRGEDTEVMLEVHEITLSDLFNQMATSSASIWKVDRYGDLYFGPPEQAGHKIRYITDSSAGKQSPAWKSVRVIGDGAVSSDGWVAATQISEEAATIDRNLFEDPSDPGTSVLEPPTFVYRNMELKTRKERENALNEITDKLNEQRASGWVEVVGYPEIFPWDAIEMPFSRKQPFGRERYMVKTVNHRINDQDGFLTRIECGGVTDPAKAVYTEPGEALDIEVPENALDDSRFETGGSESVEGITGP